MSVRNQRSLLAASLAASLALVVAGCGEAQPEATIARAEAPVQPEVVKTESLPDVKFVEITKEAGINFVHQNAAKGEKLLPETMGSGVAFLDFDGDGDQDLLFINSIPWPEDIEKDQPLPTQALYRNDGQGHFEDATASAGLDQSFFGMGVAVGDIENDGDPDLYITTLNGGKLFRNDGGQFTDITEPAGAGAGDGWLTSAAFFDMENDGDLDLFLCQYLDWSAEYDRAQNFQLAGTGQGRAYGPPTAFPGTLNILLRNDGKGHFEDISKEAGIEVRTPDQQVPAGKSLGVAPLDIDGDGFVDLAVANDTVPNFLFHNLGNGTFEEVGMTSGIAFDQSGAARGAMGIDWADFKNDGSLGLAIGNFANEMTALYVTDDPTSMQFSDLANIYGLGAPTQPPLKFGLFWFDYDLDGRSDLLSTNGHLESDIVKVQASQSYPQPAQLFWNTGRSGRTLFALVGPESAGPDLFTPIVGREQRLCRHRRRWRSRRRLDLQRRTRAALPQRGGQHKPLAASEARRQGIQPRRHRREGHASNGRKDPATPALPGEGLSVVGRVPLDLRSRRGPEGRSGNGPLAVGSDHRIDRPRGRSDDRRPGRRTVFSLTSPEDRCTRFCREAIVARVAAKACDLPRLTSDP